MACLLVGLSRYILSRWETDVQESICAYSYDIKRVGHTPRYFLTSHKKQHGNIVASSTRAGEAPRAATQRRHYEDERNYIEKREQKETGSGKNDTNSYNVTMHDDDVSSYY